MNIENVKVELDLTSIDGNAFSLMGAFSQAAERQKISKEIIDEILQEATK